jgi:hypothetical protein
MAARTISELRYIRMFFSSLKKSWLVLFALTGLCAPAALAQTWVGSTGTVDPGSANLVKFVDGRVELNANAPVGATALVRYNVLPVRDLATDLTSIEYRIFAARFLNDGGGHVVLLLKQYNVNTGVVSTLLTFDSNGSAPSASYQLGNTPGNPTFNFTWADSEGFNPADSVYYVEAQLTRTAAGGKVGLAGFAIKKIVP